MTWKLGKNNLEGLLKGNKITFIDNSTEKGTNLYSSGIGTKALGYGRAGNLSVQGVHKILGLDALSVPKFSEGPLLGRHIQFDNNAGAPFDLEANPNFLLGKDYFGENASGNIDSYLRGGASFFNARANLDTQRIKTFLTTPNGRQFIQKQTALQLLNPREETNVFNAGVSMMAQIRGGGNVNFRRHGLIPTPANSQLAQDLIGSVGGTRQINLGSVGDFLGIGSIGLGGDYVGVTPFNRTINYETGDPGKPTAQEGLQILIDLDKPKDPRIYQVGSLEEDFEQNITRVDKLNYQDIITLKGGVLPSQLISVDQDELKKGEAPSAPIYHKDMVNFRFEVLNHDSADIHSEYDTDLIIFRAFIDGYSDSFNANHNSFKYNGRGEEFYTYNSFKRSISVDFKIAAQTRHEMKPLYRKLNYLAAQTAPNYSVGLGGGRIRTPYMRLTMGDYFNRIPGVISSVNISWQKDYTWEIALDKKEVTTKQKPSEKGVGGQVDQEIEVTTTVGQDAEMLVLPHVLDVKVQFLPIHDFTPNNQLSTPFIGIKQWLN